MHELDQIAQDITCKYFGNSLAVGKYFLFEGKPIKIIKGFFLDPVHHRLSNYWTWQEILSDGSLGEKQSGYGGDDNIFKPLTEQEAYDFAKETIK